MSKGNYSLSKHPHGWRADAIGDDGGILIYRSSGDSYAIPSLDVYLMPLSQGERGRVGSVKNKDGSIASEIYMMMALIIEGENPYLAERFRRRFLIVANKVDGFEGDDYAESLVRSSDAFKDFVGEWFVSLVKQCGANGLAAAHSWLKKIETKTRKPTGEEKDLLKAIEAATEQIQDVPTKKAVRDLWLGGRAGRDDEQFSSMLKMLGFQWLPSAPRGAGAYRK